MRQNVLQLAADLARRGERFAVATVVRREPPSSAHVGDAALIKTTGEFHGWLGGSCTEPVVVREALDALERGEPRLIALSPNPDADRRRGVRVLPMTCHSGGTVDIYIEPVQPAPRLLVFGISPPAKALAGLAHVMGYSVLAVDPEADHATFPDARVTPAIEPDKMKEDGVETFAVVATLGERDEVAIREALDAGADYVGVVASRKRFEEVRENLKAAGVSGCALGRVKNPAGLDIGAVTPPEIALSILAEIVEHRRAARSDVDHDATTLAVATDPVCGMEVDPASARYSTEFQGRPFYFCCGGCEERFLASPEVYSAIGSGEKS